MSQAWTLGAAFVGGLGLFLLGMRLMTDGLKVAAGRMLRDLLARWTRTRARGLLAGVAITAAVQSSSAVTVATIGFVNAGLLDLGRALWVVFGSNVGTTMTAWLVALTGLEVDLEALALPMIGAGMLLRLTGEQSRRGAIGEAIAGFGLFFLGLEILQGAFAALGEGVDFSTLGGRGPLRVLLFFGVGILLTVVMQSSSAALALTLTAAVGGLVGLEAAGAMVIGANLGTTSTAVLVAIGATPAARRTAVGHVVFNLMAAAVAFALLPWLLDALRVGLRVSGGGGHGPVLALFHTVFNVLGVLAIWPLSDRLVRALSARFVTEEERKGEPRHLDPSTLSVPEVALDALAREMARATRHAGEIVALALRAPRPDRVALERRASGFDRLMAEIGRAITALDRSEMTAATSEGLARLIRVSRHLLTAVEEAQLVALLREDALAAGVPGARLEDALGEALRRVAEASNPEAEGFALGRCEGSVAALKEPYQAARAALLEAAREGEAKARAAMSAYHLIAELRRSVRHLVRACRDLEPLRTR